MACGCSKPSGSYERPVIAGRRNGAEPVQVVANRSMGRFVTGKPTWVTGEALQQWLDNGWVSLV